MIVAQFIFKPGSYDERFHELDGQIDAFASSLQGFIGSETWQSSDGSVKNACYYFDDMDAVRELSQFAQHREAKSEVERWYDGYQIIVSEVRATYGDGRLPHITTDAG